MLASAHFAPLKCLDAEDAEVATASRLTPPDVASHVTGLRAAAVAAIETA